ncbi:bifunctional methylenetetrahydrofolate dehydrogenase/methenyltetrahydrofolate cyclohydrolase FolD [Blastopirellula marina]|uniref:Bifunctional protein FolD n=1 Tax=Blastopirellula marina DSM 3645 TaxID=314230 RepID=A4A279_9BACT|nr:bifunctional methylenetetrahydrofolate dehydrogenase/methenyltetrahydrofolate cyclohydrolase FolD [Blastopirellula marina]EAQ77111.1 5,20-methylene-tetrahyrdofolate dehydrogenase (NADP+) /methylentetrahydrofolate cyclohydrolase [Blastopirellula marina DSM 3645]
MTAKILDGKAIAQQIEVEIHERAAAFEARTGRRPGLAAVLVGDDPASQVYVRNKERACARVGIQSHMHRLPDDTTAAELMALIAQLNADPAVSGILVQLPLPAGIDPTPILDAIDPAKDVDCFHPQNVGLVSQGRPRFLPCTPHGVLQILHRSGISAAGKHAVIIGRSEIVGKPMALMLMQKDSTCGSSAANATVTVCHSRTADMPAICRTADILIAAIGKPKFVTADMVKPGAAVIDVGINRTDDGLCGDVDFESVKEVASAITPVPGGVGPLTVVMLMENTLRAAEWQAAQ